MVNGGLANTEVEIDKGRAMVEGTESARTTIYVSIKLARLREF